MFDFVDYFAGVGGFHAALSGLGGRAVQACEIDPKPAAIYEHNWNLKPEKDVRELARHPELIPAHSVLAGGFPCQPFSKSGRQLGIAEDRGTLFEDVLKILEAKQPPVVMLENVRNLAGPRQQAAWLRILRGLREAGYRVGDRPTVFSPHLLSRALGGAPQVRDRVYILGVWVGRDRAMTEIDLDPVVPHTAEEGWDVSDWSIEADVLLPEPPASEIQRYKLSGDEIAWIDTWNELLAMLGDAKLPGFPLWEFAWHQRRPNGYRTMPAWKQKLIEQNRDFYLTHRSAIDAWRSRDRDVPLSKFPASRRKFEWQAGSGERDLWKHLMQLRPSGIRVKQATYAPALVAMSQTPIFGPRRRRLTPPETARLQGFDPTTFSFADQPDSASYKQMGNAVNVGVVRHVFKAFVEKNADDIAACGPAGTSILESLGIDVPLVSTSVAAS
ncbi:DNA (cytosine-5-)-methyltransferase [Nocardioides terrisoli]|uniref:DNA (cytosine-5-)-methyltransferase n=1 Tax=Nocardioides terrisoli TaxID=3388267 RepID=UPI00287BAEEF|nr:DNA (cytosine-5-)-methyltransferase [Nocardioides marmorisolisilvae]